LAAAGCRRKLYLGLNGLGDVDHRIYAFITRKPLVDLVFMRARALQIDAKYRRFPKAALRMLVKRALNALSAVASNA
jgi:hypothetical protein